MADAPSQSTTRPDLDIEMDIQDLIAHYPPLAHDQHHFRCEVNNGVVWVTGNLKSRVTQQYLLTQLPKIDGVREVQGQGLVNDDHVSRDVGKLVPTGVFVNVEYGIVKLTGRLEEGTSIDGLVDKISQQVTGIKRIYTSFI
jgi:hypothetical protein